MSPIATSVNREFRSPGDLYEFAPDAGIVRLLYLPRSRWAVNLERTPDARVDVAAEGVSRKLDRAAAAWTTHDKVGAAEARAEMAAIEHGPGLTFRAMALRLACRRNQPCWPPRSSVPGAPCF